MIPELASTLPTRGKSRSTMYALVTSPEMQLLLKLTIKATVATLSLLKQELVTENNTMTLILYFAR